MWSCSNGLGTPLYSRYVRHHGQPDKVLCAELEALERTHAGIAAAVTGTGADRVGRLLGACAVNEVIAQVAAASFRCPQARSVIDIGGQDSKYIQLEPAGEGDGLRLKDFSVSSMCASGTGSFLDQQATRLGLDIETEFGEAALRSRAPARIAGRCSVFAKSDIDPPPAEGHPRRGHRSRAVPRAGPQLQGQRGGCEGVGTARGAGRRGCRQRGRSQGPAFRPAP